MATVNPKSWLDWQLRQGSHEFPGPDGGTCINEAALVVAGFAYREVMSIRDLPESFCPVIGQYALTLNDAMPEGEVLNRLRPFAARLPGSSDGRKGAVLRARFLAVRAAQAFVPSALEAFDPDAAARLRAEENPDAALAQLRALAAAEPPLHVREAVGGATRALGRALAGKDPIYTAELAAVSVIRAAALDASAWDLAIAALAETLAIGRQADPIETRLVEARAAKVLAGV